MDPDRATIGSALRDLGIKVGSFEQKVQKNQDLESMKTEITELRSEIADMRSELNSKIDEFREMIVSLPVLAGRDYLERHYENTRDGKMSI